MPSVRAEHEISVQGGGLSMCVCDSLDVMLGLSFKSSDEEELYSRR